MGRPVAWLLVTALAWGSGSAWAQGGDHEGKVPLRLRSEPDGARVILLSPQTDVLGTTPIRHGWVPRGPVVLRFELDGYEPKDIEHDAQRRVTVEATLEPVNGPPAPEGGAAAGPEGAGASPGSSPDGPGSAPPATDGTSPATGNADATGETGTLAVTGTPQGADVYVNEQHVGTLPFTGRFPPGTHTVRVSADGHAAVSRQAIVETGMSTPLELVAEPLFGRVEVIVRGPVQATVTLDGDRDARTEAGAVAFDEVPAGSHEVVARADAYEEAAAQCELAAGERCQITLELEPRRAPLTVGGEPRGAEVLVDGEVVGRVPWEGQVELGQHLVEVRAEGHERRSTRVTVPADGAKHEVRLRELERDPAIASPGEGGAPALGSAYVLAPGSFALSLAAGFPTLGELALQAGVLDGVVSAGLAVRGYERFGEAEANVKIGFELHDLLAVGARVRGGGGVGRHGTNTGFVLLEGLGTLRLLDRLYLTVFAAGDYYSDDYAFSAVDDDERLPKVLGQMPRQDMIRLRVGGAFDVSLSSRVSLFGRVEWVALDGSDEEDFESTRRLLGDLFESGRTDPRIYGQLGLAIGL